MNLGNELLTIDVVTAPDRHETDMAVMVPPEDMPAELGPADTDAVPVVMAVMVAVVVTMHVPMMVMHLVMAIARSGVGRTRHAKRCAGHDHGRCQKEDPDGHVDIPESNAPLPGGNPRGMAWFHLIGDLPPAKAVCAPRLRSERPFQPSRAGRPRRSPAAVNGS
jgi:hypothetical protein